MFENITFDVKGWLSWLLGKLLGLLGSHKFWALVVAIVAIAQGVALGELEYVEAVKALVVAVGIFMGAKAYEDAHR